MKLDYLGFFNLPRPQGADERFGFGVAALSLTPRGTMWASGKVTRGLVAEISVPEPGGTAEIVTPFREPAPRQQLVDAKLDRLVGLAEHEGKLCALFQEFYQVSGIDGGRVSFWDGENLVQLGEGRLKDHAGYLTSHDGKLFVGRSSGAGNADVNHGPALYEVAEDTLGLIERFRHVRPDWSPADAWRGVAFLPGHVCWLVRKAVGAPAWYGQATGPNGEIDKWNTSKGYHSDRYEVWLLPYSFPDFKALPPIVLDGFHEASWVGGCAYDAAKQRLLVAEVWPPKKTGSIYPGEWPRIHTYAVSATASGPVEPPDEEANEHLVRIDVQGIGTFTGSGVWRKA